MFYFRWDIVWKYTPYLVQGLGVTFEVTLYSVIIGLAVGLIIALLRLSGVRPVAVFAVAYIEFFRNVPVLVQLVWAYYVLPIFTGIDLSPIVSCSIALGINSSAYMAEIYRAGIQTIPKGQVEAGRSVGMSSGQVMRRIILPQAIRSMIPAFANMFVMILKSSALVAVVGVLDLMHRGDIANTATFRPVEIYTTVAGIYFLLCYLLSTGVAILERRLAIEY